jgi:hypothetical protein
MEPEMDITEIKTIRAHARWCEDDPMECKICSRYFSAEDLLKDAYMEYVNLQDG